MSSEIHLTPLVEEADELRLITILPAQNGDEAAPVCCRLDTVSLQASFLVSHPPKDIEKKPESLQPGIYDSETVDVESSDQEASKEHTKSSWYAEPATSSLPDFRYEWGDFLALSYTWGDPSITREITINGISMQVTKNLDDCLRALRTKDYIKTGWKIWIDALCINQQDIIERGKEVRRMLEIYSTAYTPIVWLGLEDEYSEKAIQLIELLARQYCHAPDPVNSLTDALHKNLELFGPGSWLAMHEYVTRRYWSRMWIIQEVAQGKENIPVLCGDSTISWALVSPVFKLILHCDEVVNVYTHNEVKAAGLEMKWSELWANLGTVKDMRMFQKAMSDGQRLPHDRVLQMGRMVSATDPRDKIYGLLGLFHEELRNRIRTDYTSSVRDVYTDFVKVIIDSGSLDFLYHCYSTTRPEFPTWLPDWSAPRLVGSPLIFGDNPFSTCGSSKAEVQFLDNDTLLSCRGVLFDKVDGLGHTWDTQLPDPAVLPPISMLNPYGSREKVQEAIWKTIVCDRDVELHPLAHSYECLLAAPWISEQGDLGQKHIALQTLARSNIFVWFVNFCKADAELLVCGQSLMHYFDAVDVNEMDAALFREALIRRDHVSSGRRFFTTEKGYFGIGLDRVQRGDVVAVLMGATMPVILRREGEYYRFVGECYIHGVMNGEVMEAVQTGAHHFENFVLC